MNAQFRSPTPSTLTKRTVRQNAPRMPELPEQDMQLPGIFELSKLGRLLAMLGANQNPMEIK